MKTRRLQNGTDTKTQRRKPRVSSDSIVLNVEHHQKLIYGIQGKTNFTVMKPVSHFVYLIFVTSFLSPRVKGVEAAKAKAASKIIEEEIVESGTSNFKCKSTRLSYFIWLLHQGQLKKAKFCLATHLKKKPKTSKAWSLLGEMYDSNKQTKKANLCFKEAIKLEGKFSPYFQSWDFLGPFPIGKAELDGDPVEGYDNNDTIVLERWKENLAINSEIARNATIHWKILHQSDNEKMQIYPDVDWNQLINSLQSTGVTEWQGLVVSDFAVNEDNKELLFQCPGFHTFQVDHITITGDVYHRTQYWFPVTLKRGIHQLKIHLRANPAAIFNCQVKANGKHATVKLHEPNFIPDFVGNVILSRYLSVPVSNLNSKKSIKIAKILVSSSDFPDGVNVSPKIMSNDQSIAPGQLSSVKIELLTKFEDGFQHAFTCDQKAYSMKLKLAFSDGKSEQLQVPFQCRNWKERFSFTFKDHDGSIQHASAIPPLMQCSLQACPVLLSLHGTGVKAENQADSYKRMTNGNFQFGVEKLWVLAPTRHGAHNWEGPGELTSMTALYELEKLTEEHTWIKSKASSKYVVFSGHSMGGHGSWQLSLHHPDLAIGVISAAGWLKKEDYGDSNLFYRHDISISHTDPAVKVIQEACIAENDADKHASNLKGIPVMIRTGADDRTVHPFFSRRMFRILKENGVNVTYNEYAGKEHWWWDTFKTNDGGVTNDPVIRGFAIQRVKELEKELGSSCRRDSKSSNECSDNLSNGKQRYKNQENIDRNRNSPFTLTVYNPASFKGLRGVRVLQQSVPFRKSTLQISFSKDSAKIKTSNVKRILLYEPAISPIMWKKRTIRIDDREFKQSQFEVDLESNIQVCKENQGQWELCQDQNEHFETELIRGPSNLGPARRIAERPFLIVVGTQGNEKVKSVLLELAVYLANLFFLTSDTHVSIINDKNIEENIAKKYNLIIIGSKEENLWTSQFMDHIPIKQSGDTISLGQCKFSEKDMGLLFLTPHATKHLALVISATSLQGLRNIFKTVTPTIPPMTRSPLSNMIPDFVITGPDFEAKGPGGFLCSGFWGNKWDYRLELSSCTC